MRFHVVRAASPIAHLVFQSAPEEKKKDYLEKYKDKDLRKFKMVLCVKDGEIKPHFLDYVPNKVAVNAVASKIAEIAQQGSAIIVYGEDENLYEAAIRQALAKTGACRINIKREKGKAHLMTTIECKIRHL